VETTSQNRPERRCAASWRLSHRTSMVEVHRLIAPELLVEIEIDAVIL